MDQRTRYRWHMLLAEANECHNCGRWREPYHDCPAFKITKILWDKWQEAHNA